MFSKLKPRLEFETPVVILGCGRFDRDRLAALVNAGYPLIAADGAADIAREAGLRLNAIIGDFDSIRDPSVFGDDLTKIKIPEQETTDLEKCLYSVQAPLFLCFGVLGGRFDHSLAAVHAVARFACHKNIVLVDQQDISLGVAGDFEIALPVGTRFSVFPLVATGFERSTGLEYPLDGLLLQTGERIGTSNRTSKAKVVLVTERNRSGYLVILPAMHLATVIALFDKDNDVGARSSKVKIDEPNTNAPE